MPTTKKYLWKRRGRCCRTSCRRLDAGLLVVAALCQILGCYGWPINRNFLCRGGTSTLSRKWSPLDSSISMHHHHQHPQSCATDASQSAIPASALVIKMNAAQQSQHDARTTTTPSNISSTTTTQQSHPPSSNTTTLMMVLPDTQNASLSSPRLWLESQSCLDARGGAYTVLRCDYCCNKQHDDDPSYHKKTTTDGWGKHWNFIVLDMILKPSCIYSRQLISKQ